MRQDRPLGVENAGAGFVARGGPPTGKDTLRPPRLRRQILADRIKNAPWLKPLVFALALLPFAWVTWAFASDLLNNTRLLGADPIKASEHFTGKWALRFLLITLAVTPAIRLTRWGWLIRYRRTFGLFAFFYACVHLSIYFGLDIELTWSLLVEDVLDRLYITFAYQVGLAPDPGQRISPGSVTTGGNHSGHLASWGH